MKKLKKFWMKQSGLGVLAIFLTLWGGCGSLQKVALNTTSELMVGASEEMETETNWNIFKESVPAQLKLLEGLLYVQKDQKELLSTLTKGYAAYGLAVHETLSWEDSLQGIQDSHAKSEAITNFSKALRHGLTFLELHGLHWNELRILQQDVQNLKAKFDKKLKVDHKNLETIFYLGVAWASFINLQKDRPQVVSQLPLVKGLFDWVCSHNPQFQFGGCGLFNGSYEAGRPAMLGGNPEKGKEIFLQAIKENPHNHLIRMAYIQYYLVPLMDQEGYEEQKKALEAAKVEFEKKKHWSPADGSQEGENPRLNLFNATAFKRFEIIKKYEKEIF